jgi:polysaccharide export outer membrane protein
MVFSTLPRPWALKGVVQTLGGGLVGVYLAGVGAAAIAQPTLPLESPPHEQTSLPANLPTTLPGVLSEDPSQFDDYRLGPGDSIFVGVQRFPDLSFEATLDIQGHVVMPLAGALSLTGLTLDEARDTVFAIYDRYVVNPEVAVTLTAQRPVQVTVVGEVPRPGLYPLQAPQLSVALLTAGGSTSLADLRIIQVERALANQDVLTRTVDLFTPLQQGAPLPQVRLQDGDVITVPRLAPGAIEGYDRDLVATSTLAKAEITVRVMNRASGGRGTEARFGAINLRNGSRFLDALAAAGVNPDLAAYDRIAVLRFNADTGTADTIMVNARAAVGGDATQNISLQENDVIVVDRNLTAQITYTLNTFTQPFRDVLGFLLFFDSLTNAADSLFGP